MLCPYINVNAACSVSSPISELPTAPMWRQCNHVEGRYCSDFAKYGGTIKDDYPRPDEDGAL